MEFCLLNLLRGGEAYGYEIVQNPKLIDELAVSESTVYPILTRLKQDEYLRVRTVPSSGGPPRRYFSLTRLGDSYVEQMNQYWEGLVEAVDRIRSQEHKKGETR